MSATNLWETLLRESSKRSKLPEGTVLFFGNMGCGKNVLLEKFCSSNLDTKTSGIGRGKAEVISYNFFNAADADDGPVDQESVSRVSVWSFNNQTFGGALDIVLNPTKIEKASNSLILHYVFIK